MGRRAKSISSKGQNVYPRKNVNVTAQTGSKPLSSCSKPSQSPNVTAQTGSKPSSTCSKPSQSNSNDYLSNLFKSPSMDWTVLVPNKQPSTMSSEEPPCGQILPTEGGILPLLPDFLRGQMLPTDEDSLPESLPVSTDKATEPPLVPSENEDTVQKLITFFFRSNSLFLNPDCAAQDLDNLCDEFSKIALKHYPHYVSFDQNSAQCQQSVHNFMVCITKTNFNENA